MADQTLTLKDVQAKREECNKNLAVAQRMFAEAQAVIQRNRGALALLDAMEAELTGKKNGKKTKKDKRKKR